MTPIHTIEDDYIVSGLNDQVFDLVRSTGKEAPTKIVVHSKHPEKLLNCLCHWRVNHPRGCTILHMDNAVYVIEDGRRATVFFVKLDNNTMSRKYEEGEAHFFDMRDVNNDMATKLTHFFMKLRLVHLSVVVNDVEEPLPAWYRIIRQSRGIWEEIGRLEDMLGAEEYLFSFSLCMQTPAGCDPEKARSRARKI